MQPLRLQAEIEIDGTPERVWDVLTDVAAYPEWNPFVLRVVGRLEEGSAITVRLSLPEGDETEFDAVVVKNAHAEALRFRSVVMAPWLMQRDLFYELRPLPGDRCRLSGLLLKLSGKTAERMARGFVYMNQALKRRVEGRALPA
jgi:hypothetical protein